MLKNLVHTSKHLIPTTIKGYTGCVNLKSQVSILLLLVNNYSFVVYAWQRKNLRKKFTMPLPFKKDSAAKKITEMSILAF